MISADTITTICTTLTVVASGGGVGVIWQLQRVIMKLDSFSSRLVTLEVEHKLRKETCPNRDDCGSGELAFDGLRID